MKKIPLLLLPLLFLAPGFVHAGTAFSTNLVRASVQSWSKASPSGTATRASVQSMFMKVKFTTLPTSGNFYMLWGVGDSSDGQYIAIHNNAGQQTLRYADGDAGLEQNISITTGVWYTVGFVRSGTGANQTTTYFDNGAGANFSSNPATGSAFINSIWIGAHYGGSNELDGRIGEVRYWSRALSSSEYTTYQSTPCSFTNGASMISWWKFNNDGTDSNGSNNLTNNGSATFTSDVPYSCATAGTKSSVLGLVKSFWIR